MRKGYLWIAKNSTVNPSGFQQLRSGRTSLTSERWSISRPAQTTNPSHKCGVTNICPVRCPPLPSWTPTTSKYHKKLPGAHGIHSCREDGKTDILYACRRLLSPALLCPELWVSHSNISVLQDSTDIPVWGMGHRHHPEPQRRLEHLQCPTSSHCHPHQNIWRCFWKRYLQPPASQGRYVNLLLVPVCNREPIHQKGMWTAAWHLKRPGSVWQGLSTIKFQLILSDSSVFSLLTSLKN